MNAKVHRILASITLAMIIGAALVVTLQTGYLWKNRQDWQLPNGRVLGPDFLTFYLAGAVVRQDPVQLYASSTVAELRDRKLAQRGITERPNVFIYPPLVAAVFSVFSVLDYPVAYFVWTGFSAMLLVGSLYLVRVSVVPFWLSILTALAFYPWSVECVGLGQTSCFGLTIFSLCYCLLKQRRDYAAGVVLSLSYYKPPLFLFFLLAFVSARQWRLLAGFAVGAGMLIVATVLLFGWDGFMRYAFEATQYRYGAAIPEGRPPLLPVMGVGLLALLQQNFPRHSMLWQLTILSVSCLLVVLLAPKFQLVLQPAQRRTDEFLLWFCLLVTLSLLLSLQMPVYDLTILLPFLIAALGILWRKESLLLPRIAVGIGVVLLFTDFLFRNVEIGSFTIKMPTLGLMLLAGGLFRSLEKRRV